MSNEKTSLEEASHLTQVERAAIMEAIIRDTFWMVRRYAHMRRSYPPSMVNRAIDLLETIGIELPEDQTLDDGPNKYVSDVDFGEWCPVMGRFELKKENKS